MQGENSSNNRGEISTGARRHVLHQWVSLWSQFEELFDLASCHLLYFLFDILIDFSSHGIPTWKPLLLNGKKKSSQTSPHPHRPPHMQNLIWAAHLCIKYSIHLPAAVSVSGKQSRVHVFISPVSKHLSRAMMKSATAAGQ